MKSQFKQCNKYIRSIILQYCGEAPIDVTWIQHFGKNQQPIYEEHRIGKAKSNRIDWCDHCNNIVMIHPLYTDICLRCGQFTIMFESPKTLLKSCLNHCQNLHINYQKVCEICYDRKSWLYRCNDCDFVSCLIKQTCPCYKNCGYKNCQKRICKDYKFCPYHACKVLNGYSPQ